MCEPGHKKGFTILELVIVVMIIGVMSSLALPRFFGLIEYSRSVEAINAIRVIRESVERCALWTGDPNDCHLNTPGPNPNNIDIEDPGLDPNSHFTYRKQALGVPFIYRIEARRNNRNGGNVGDRIRYDYRANGTIVKVGSGAFEAIK